MKRWGLLVFLLTMAGTAHAVNRMTGYWVSDGGDKIAQEKFFQHTQTASSTTVSRVWNPTTGTASIFSARGQMANLEVVGYNNSGVLASSITVSMSSMTCDSGDGIVSVSVSSFNVTDTSGRPIQTFSAAYVQHIGMSNFPYGRDEYEERQYPLDSRVPCTITAGHCIPDGGTDLWTQRLYGNKNVPVAWVPVEEFSASSQTVATGKSQSWWTDIWVSSGIPATTCHGYWRAFEGVTLSTEIPVNLKVYNVILPVDPRFKEIVEIGNDDLTGRMGTGRGAPTPFTGQNLSVVQNTYKMLRAHSMIPIGDEPDHSTDDFPSTVGKTMMTGSLFTAANGYGNARGVNTGVSMYVIGPYVSWNFSQTNATSFSTELSSWAANINAMNSTATVVLYGQDEVSDQTTNNMWAGWVDTNTTYGTSTKAYMFVTGGLPTLASTANRISYPVSTNVFGNGIENSSTTWETNSNNYNASPSSAAWRYNSGAIGQGAVFSYDEEGYVPESNYWGYAKKLCLDGSNVGTCHAGHFCWEGNYWLDSNETGSQNNLFSVAKTFGFDSASDPVFGRQGFLYSEGDGVLVFYGRDSVFTPSYGFNGPIATFTMKNMRKGIDDVDILMQAYAVDSSSTTNILNNLYSKALWDVTCQDSSDCTYSYGDRSWQYASNNWVNARESLLIIAAQASPPVTPPSTEVLMQGQIKFTGNVKILK